MYSRLPIGAERLVDHKEGCFLCWLVFPTYTFYALGFLAWGTAEAFASGTEEVLLYDSLKHKGLEKEFEKVYSRSQALPFSVMGYLALQAASALICSVFHSYSSFPSYQQRLHFFWSWVFRR